MHLEVMLMLLAANSRHTLVRPNSTDNDLNILTGFSHTLVHKRCVSWGPGKICTPIIGNCLQNKSSVLQVHNGAAYFVLWSTISMCQNLMVIKLVYLLFGKGFEQKHMVVKCGLL